MQDVQTINSSEKSKHNSIVTSPRKAEGPGGRLATHMPKGERETEEDETGE